MSARSFLDTNIFVYSFDDVSPSKKAKAQELIEGALKDHSAIISTQVVQEFLNVASKKFVQPLAPRDRRLYLNSVLAPLCSVFPTLSLYGEALAILEETGYSFYDSLIIAGALKGQCKTLLTEDLQHGQTVRGLRIENPFLP